MTVRDRDRWEILDGHDDLRQLDHHESWEGVCDILEAQEGMDHA